MTARRGRRKAFLALAAALAAAAGVQAASHRLRWRLWLEARGVPKMHDLSLTTDDYEIEQLPLYFRASFVRGHDVYLADPAGRVFKADDRAKPEAAVELGNSRTPPRLLFVSSRGTIFVSGPDRPLVRSQDGGKTWTQSHGWSFWRMAEDEAGHAVYAGNYSPKGHPAFMAKVLKSEDEGKTWRTVFQDERLDHIHSIRWDAAYSRLYLSAGDGDRRGQAFTEDGGATWRWIASGGKQGHTDVAISDHCVFWGSDDNFGRVIRSPRDPPQDGTTILWAPDHHVWWVVADGRQVYAGTLTGERGRRTGAFLMASADEGETWQKLLEDEAGGAAISAFNAESRGLSAEGWFYCATDSGRAYRVRRRPAR